MVALCSTPQTTPGYKWFLSRNSIGLLFWNHMQCVFKYTDFCEKIIWQTTKTHNIINRQCFWGVCKGNRVRRRRAQKGECWRQEAIDKQLRVPLENSWEAQGKRIGGVIVTQYFPKGRERAGWVVCMMGQRREKPRWANDLVLQPEMLGRRQETPRWEDELLC